MLYFPVHSFIYALNSSLIHPWSFPVVAFSPTELFSRPVCVPACGCSSLLLPLSPQGRWRVLPTGLGRSGQVLWLQLEQVALLLCSLKRMILQIIVFLLGTKLLITLQNIPKLCFESSTCQIPVLPESTDDLCNSQLFWYPGMIENNMLINYNENSYPDKIFFFLWKLMLASWSQQFSC